MNLPPVIAIMGPTASGKSALALALAQELGGEIVSVDSAQVYLDMEVGTAKPAAQERALVPHHLIDLIAPTQSYSAARFCSDALAAISNIHARGRLALLAGGTMLYFKALRDGLADLPDADAMVRAQIDAQAAERGWPALHDELRSVDPATAARLKPGDAQRIQRALELYRLTGIPPSILMRQHPKPVLPFRLIEIALVPHDRAVLHERIARRFDAMLDAGLVDELAMLRRKYPLAPDMPSMRCVGYRQAWEHAEGRCDFRTLRDRGIFATRQLAKRQLTWLRDSPAQRFDCLDAGLNDKVLAWTIRNLPASR